MEPYIGKFCNKCGRTLYEDDEVIICPACGKPHHVSCWIEEEGCATKGCLERNLKKQQEEERQQEGSETQKGEKDKPAPAKKKKHVLPVILLLVVLAGAAAVFLVPGWKEEVQSLLGIETAPKEQVIQLTMDNVNDYLKVSKEVSDGKSQPSVVNKEVQYMGEGTITASVKSVQPGGYRNVTVDLKISYLDFDAYMFREGYAWCFQYGGEILPYGEQSKQLEKTVTIDLDQFGAGSAKEKLQLRGRLTSEEVNTSLYLRNGVFPFVNLNDAYFTVEITGVQGSVVLDN